MTEPDNPITELVVTADPCPQCNEPVTGITTDTKLRDDYYSSLFYVTVTPILTWVTFNPCGHRFKLGTGTFATWIIHAADKELHYLLDPDPQPDVNPDGTRRDTPVAYRADR